MTEMLNGTGPRVVVKLPERPEPADGPVGVPHHVRWRRGAARPTTVRRAVGLARFAVGTGLDPQLHRFDATVRAAVDRDARRHLDRTSRVNRRRARRCDALTDRIAHLRRRASDQTGGVPVPDPVARAATAAELIAAHERTSAIVEAQLAAGDERPRRISRGARRVGRLLPWLDAALFGYFVSGVSNANLAAPLTTPVASAVALGFTLLVVLVAAAFTPWLGRTLRSSKTATGEPAWAELGPSMVALAGLWAVLLVAMGVTMFVRVRSEAGYAGADSTTALVVSVLLALAAVVLNVYVLATAFRDGTAATDDLHARGRVRARQLRRAQRCVTRADALARRRARIAGRSAAAEATALARAERRIAHGERLLVLGRMRTGVEREPVDARDRLDLMRLM